MGREKSQHICSGSRNVARVSLVVQSCNIQILSRNGPNISFSFAQNRNISFWVAQSHTKHFGCAKTQHYVSNLRKVAICFFRSGKVAQTFRLRKVEQYPFSFAMVATHPFWVAQIRSISCFGSSKVAQNSSVRQSQKTFILSSNARSISILVRTKSR